MCAASSWNDANGLLQFFGEQLARGRLTAAIGAGASLACGLPDWGNLLKELFKSKNLKWRSGSLLTRADEILQAFDGDHSKLDQEIRRVLYQNKRFDGSSLSQIPLLAALGALVVGSKRGSVTQIISLNYDDLLATFLGYYGCSIKQTALLPLWAGNHDVTIYHPHGLLPCGSNSPIERPVVIARLDYDHFYGNSPDWEAMISGLWRSNFCLFIGLSGLNEKGEADQNLGRWLHNAWRTHLARDSKFPYWGIWFYKTAGMDQISFWRDRGVFPKKIADFDELPRNIYTICQHATKLHQ